MDKISELALVLTELKRCGESLVGISETLSVLLSSSMDSSAEQIPAESATPEENPITLEMVRAVLAEKSRNGFTAEVRALLEKHSAEKLSEINPVEYAALLAEAEVIGNG